MPNTFTPNNDGINDLFQPIGLVKKDLIQFRVFNRWGQEVFNATDMNSISWDGRFMGVAQAKEVYLFVIEYKRSFDNQSTIIKGKVTLIR